jgi:hypothetical protein
MNTKQRRVNYERSILTYIDILGFRELMATKTAGDSFLRNFSDLCIIRRPIAKKGKFPASGEVQSQIFHKF